jgi:2-oxoisovalerate dehydrogenase E2 component (dihydrolipoyl transacylase)
MSQFVLPDLGEGLEEAQLIKWLVQPGDRVHLNQPLCQVETAKAMVEIPSPYEGVVEALHGAPGDIIPVGAPLVTIGERTEQEGPHPQAPSPPEREIGRTEPERSGAVLVGYGTEGSAPTFIRRRRMAQAQRTAGTAPMATSPEAARVPVRLAPAQGPATSSPAPAEPAQVSASPASAPPATPEQVGAADDGVHATPLVRKMAREHGIDLRTITGTGPGGRIRLEDLEAALSASRPPATAVSGEAAPDEERISTIGLRKTIAARMVRSATTIPQFTVYGLFNATALVALRERLRNDPTFAGRRLTFLPFFVKALVAAVRDYPIMNSRWDEEGNAIIIKHSIHVGIATDTERGLLVPVIHHAHARSLADIAAEVDWLIQGARMGKLDAPSLTGSTITITNVGAAGPVETGAPLINPPEACIVGFGAIKPRPTVIGNDLVVRPGAWLSISCDHRIIDGATAARFLGALVRYLEEPEELVS